MPFIPVSDDNPHYTIPVLTWAFLIINILIFIFPLWSPPEAITNFYRTFALVPAELFGKTESFGALPEKATLLTASLLHADIFHIGFNMLFWIIFADNIEYAFGKIRFILFLAASSVVSMGLHAFLNQDSALPLMGFSGVISAAMGAYMVLYPKATVGIINPLYISPLLAAIARTMPPTIGIPAWIVLGLWFSQDLIGFFTTEKDPEVGGIAFAAHVGGFIFGALLGRILRVNTSLYELKEWKRQKHENPHS